MTKKEYVAYYKNPVYRYGNGYLGIQEQQHIIQYFVRLDKGILMKKYSDNRNESCNLQKAITYCRKNKATLIVITLDCLAMNVSDVLDMKRKLNNLLKVCDLPIVDSFYINLSLALIQRNKEIASIITKAALNDLKSKGKQL